VFERERKSVVRFVGFSFLLEWAGAFFAVLFCVFLLVGVGEECSLAGIGERLPLGGVGAGRSIKVLMLAVCAMPVCTGVLMNIKSMYYC